jgi:hypothetical protein
MKNFKYLFAFLAFGFIGCEPDTGDESYMENRDLIAGFTATSGTIFATAEGTNTFVLTVAVSQIMSADTTFGISVDETSTAVLGTDFTLSANSIVVPAGEFSGSVNVVADFDAASFDGKSLVFNLTPAAGSLLGKASCSLEIVKSCPIPDALEASYTANPFAFDEDAPEFTATFTRVGTTGLTYAVDSGWGPEFVAWATGSAAYSGLYIYPCELTVNADGTVAVTGSSFYTTGGSGTFDACTGVISVTLTQALFTSPFTVDVTFTP